MSLTPKKFGHLMMALADKLDIDDFDDLIAPLIEDICESRGWDFEKILEEHEEVRS